MTDADNCRTPGCRTPPEPGYCPRGLCGWCEQRGLEAIRALPADHADLQPLVWDKPAGGLGNLGGKFGPSEPVNLAADALAREIAYTAVLWEIPIREAARLSDAPNQHGQPDAADLDRAAGILAAHFTALTSLGPVDHIRYDRRPDTADGVDAVIALTGLHRRARSMCAITTRQTSMPGMCSVCQTETLRHKDGGNDVWCVMCGSKWTWDEYQDAIALVPVGRVA